MTAGRKETKESEEGKGEKKGRKRYRDSISSGGKAARNEREEGKGSRMSHVQKVTV